MNFSKKNYEHLNNKSGVSKKLKLILVIGFALNVAVATAQEEAYVAAESGLSLRDQPDVSAKMLSKLAYGEAIGILEQTDKKLVVLDGGKKVSGEWVKVETRNHIGYVFNGYLSPNKIARTIRVNLDKATVEIKNLATIDYKRNHNLKSKTTAVINVDKSDTPERKKIILTRNEYKHVSLFQRYESSFSFISADATCNTNEWRRVETNWKPLKQDSKNTFETLIYNEKNWIDVVKNAISEVDSDVVDKCGKDWLAYVKTIKNMKDFPVSVTTNRFFIKFILTDFEDRITERVIEFELPNKP